MAKAKGSSDLAKQEQRLAYLLLAPTFHDLACHCHLPAVFRVCHSFTNATFASSKPDRVCGLDNYQQLAEHDHCARCPPKLDEATGQPQIDAETGEIEYESAVSSTCRANQCAFKQVTQFNLFGTNMCLGATDPDFIRAIWDTIVFAVATVFLELVLGMVVALIVNANFKGRGLMRAIILVPWAIPTAVSSQMWAYMLTAESHRFLQHGALVSGALATAKFRFCLTRPGSCRR